MRTDPDAQAMQAAEYRPIPNFTKYGVSQAGEIINLRTGRIKSLSVNPRSGYVSVSLPRDDGLQKNITVHRAVALAWLPKPEWAECVAHLDGNKKNNRVANLMWATNSENCLHKKGHGTQQHGGTHPFAKLDEDKVLEMRRLYQRHMFGYLRLAKKYGVSTTTVKDVIKGRQWTHVALTPQDVLGGG